MPSPLSDTDLETIRSEAAAGRKIEAIKLYRAVTGAGLADAKAFIERLENDPHAVSGASVSLDANTAQRIQEAIFAGNKIEAIKLHRTSSGMGLRESKVFIEAVEAELRQTQPQEFSAPPTKGCASMVLCLLVLAGLLVAALA